MKYRFSSDYGYEELPAAAKLEELPKSFRVTIFNKIYLSMKNDFHYDWISGDWGAITQDIWAFWGETLDEYSNKKAAWSGLMKEAFLEAEFFETFNLIQFLFQHHKVSHFLKREIQEIFNSGAIAYELLNDGQIVPNLDKNSTDGILKALKVTKERYMGANAHLNEAANQLNQKNYRLSITESISAVESVLKVMVGDKSATLSEALKELHTKNPTMHGSLKDSLSKLYGYTSDKEGLRHSFYADATTSVDIHDALFMLTACAAFISFLDGKFGR